MRIGDVIGSVTLSRRLAEVPAGQLLIVQPLRLETLRDGTEVRTEPVVAYDQLSAARGSRVAFSEGREAAMPFHPQPVPFDAYCSAILDAVHVDPDIPTGNAE